MTSETDFLKQAASDFAVMVEHAGPAVLMAAREHCLELSSNMAINASRRVTYKRLATLLKAELK